MNAHWCFLFFGLILPMASSSLTTNTLILVSFFIRNSVLSEENDWFTTEERITLNPTQEIEYRIRTLV